MRKRQLKELTIKDNFLFGAVMMEKKNCKHFLELALGFAIEKVEISREKSILYHPEYKGVRLDIYAKGGEPMKKSFTLYFPLFLLTALLTACGHRHVPEEDVTKLRAADEIQKVSDSIVLNLKTADLGETSKEVEVSLKNESENSHTFQEELVVDRKIDGNWYFWGKSGCYLETGYIGLEPGDEYTEAFPLYEESLGEGDFIINEKGTVFTHEKEMSNEMNHDVHICFVPGTYRIRIQVSDDKVRDGTEAIWKEAVCVFEIGEP